MNALRWATPACLLLRAGLVFGQTDSTPRFDIALQVNEPVPGTLSRPFSAALQQIPDVRILDDATHSDFIIRVIAACNPADDCAHATGYFVALQIAAPMHPSHIVLPLYIVLRQQGLRVDMSQIERASRELSRQFEDYENPGALRVALWSRAESERRVQQFVAQFDRECLETNRIAQRAEAAMAAHDTVRANSIWRDQSLSQRHRELC
jgi:hypothetical protein